MAKPPSVLLQQGEEAKRSNKPYSPSPLHLGRRPHIHPITARLGACSLPFLWGWDHTRADNKLLSPTVAAEGGRNGVDGPLSISAELFPTARWVLVQLHEKGLAGLGRSEKGRGTLILFDSLVMVLIPSC